VPVTWVQEEPVNMGAWPFVRTTLAPEALTGHALDCVARAESASPATGSLASHKHEQELLVAQALE
jgi:2-oxoglutarate dehydrogenase E1 component